MNKRDVSNQILEAVKKELMSIGFPNPKILETIFDGVREFSRSNRLPKQAKRVDPSHGLAIGYVALMVRNLEKEITRHPPKTDAELQKWLDQINGLRYRLRPQVSELIKTAHDIFPQKKRGPRPSLTEAQKQSACAIIDTYKRNGHTTRDAIEQTARSYKVKPRTMRNIWQTKGFSSR